MNLLRRCGAALLLVCSALTAVLCLGGIVGVWVINQPTKELVADTLDTIDGYLTLANQTVAQIRDRTTGLGTTLDGARQDLVAGGEAGRGAIGARITVALQEANTTLASLRNVLQALSTGVATVNRSLGQLPRLAGIVPPSMPDDLQALEQRLDSLGNRTDTLRAEVADVSVGFATLTERINGARGELRDLDDRLDQFTSRLAAAQTATVSAKARASTAINLASVGLSLLLVLFAVGQVSLGIRAWHWLRMEPEGATTGAIPRLGVG